MHDVSDGSVFLIPSREEFVWEGRTLDERDWAARGKEPRAKSEELKGKAQRAVPGILTTRITRSDLISTAASAR